MARAPARPKVAPPKTASIRDFSGGWNVADDEYNLAGKFQPVSDNIVVGVNNALAPRYGYRLDFDFKNGTEVSATKNMTFTFTNASPIVTVTLTAHGFSSQGHITFVGLIPVVGQSTIRGTYGLVVTGANTFDIIVRTAATATSTSGTFAVPYIYDTHTVGGNILDLTTFQNNTIIFTDIGEIVAKNLITNAVARIWDVYTARLLTGNPQGWRQQINELPLTRISFDTFKQSMLVVNGRDNDKPLDISFTRTAGAIVQFLIDPATGSNTNVYSADHIQSFDGYVLLYNSNNTSTTNSNTSTTTDISAAGTSGVFVGNVAPDDAVQIDLGRVTQTVDPRITGVAAIRDRVFVGFYDSAMLGKLGTYSTGTTPVHDPDFSDQIPQHGTLNRRVIANLGNDLLMCDYAGVPAYTQSLNSSAFVPDRVSQLIDPVLNAHLGRLAQDTLRYNTFAVYNVRDRQYMLFIPKYDTSSRLTAAASAFFAVPDLVANKQIIATFPNHHLTAGDFLDVSGMPDMPGLVAANLNGRRRVAFVLDDDNIVMEVGAVPSVPGATGNGGGFADPVNDEYIGYIFSYNPQLKIRRWTRYRNLYFTCGCASRDGRIFFANGKRLYQFGTTTVPLYADGIGEFDKLWSTSTSFTIGDRVKDVTDGTIWTALTNYTSPASGTFADSRTNTTDVWEAYEGKPINFMMETPWSNLGDRSSIKQSVNIHLDAQGVDAFTLSAFTDSQLIDPITLLPTPSATMQFLGLNVGGFGSGDQTYGGGRRVKEQTNILFPFRCKQVKFRVEGATTKKLVISGIHIQYRKGSFMR